ncbi:MAG: F0F1 ATP synthase subunit B [bacterium]|nr:F0F1 ATP synthase subunit B [bacterium]
MNRLPWAGKLTLALIVLGLADVVRAADEAHGDDAPSLFAGDLGNALWTLVIFGLVLVVLGKFAWKPILTALQQREAFIRDSLDQAKKDRAEAETRLEAIEERLANARNEATEIVDEGRRGAETVKRKAEQDTRAEAEAILERAQREIGLARDTAIKELYDLTAVLATDAAGKIISRQLDPKEHERLIAESIEQLTRTTNN